MLEITASAAADDVHNVANHTGHSRRTLEYLCQFSPLLLMSLCQVNIADCINFFFLFWYLWCFFFCIFVVNVAHFVVSVAVVVANTYICKLITLYVLNIAENF